MKIRICREKKRRQKLFEPIFKKIISFVRNSIKNQDIILSFIIYDV